MKLQQPSYISKIIIVIAFFSLACAKQEKVNSKTYSYLALGDSYTIGQSVGENSKWPVQLSKALNNNDISINETKIIAQTGWTTQNLLTNIENISNKNYDLVSLQIGVNNQFQQMPFNVFKTDFITLLNKSIEIAGNSERVFVLSIPDYGYTPFGHSSKEKISKELDKYNDYIEKICTEKNILFVNITDISRKLGDSKKALAYDNLHPSSYQYSAWVDEMLPNLISLLRKD